MPKQYVYRTLGCTTDFNGRSKAEILGYLNSLVVPENAVLEIKDDYYDSCKAEWVWNELETDQEEAQRLQQELKRVEYRRRQYEALAKEFGK